MERKFIKITTIFLFYLLFTKSVNAYVILKSPYNGQVLESSIVNFEWENTDSSQEYIYRHDWSKYFNFASAIAHLKLTGTNLDGVAVLPRMPIFWRVKYQPVNSFGNQYLYRSNIFVFSVGTEVPDDVMQMVLDSHIPFPEEDEEEEIDEQDVLEIEEEIKQVNENLNESKSEEPSKTDNDSTQVKGISNILKKKEEQKEENSSDGFQWNVSGNTKSKKKDTREDGSKTDIACKFKYLEGESKLVSCTFEKLNIVDEIKYPLSNTWSVVTRGNVVRKYKIQIDEYVCTFHLLKPNTWFDCKEKFLKSHIIDIVPNMFFTISNGSTRIPILSYNIDGEKFSLVGGYFKEDRGLKLTHTYRVVNSQFNIFHDQKIEYFLNPKEESSTVSNKPFSFPFSKIIGITQWYGNTAYQTPHTGIDFGAKEETVLAVDDGQVIAKGWDNYFGDCFSGGYYIRVKQNNGMHTVYFHLQDIYVNTGDSVNKGEIIAKSGNSGAWNCQSLGYHLHFETRLNESMNSHSNPVNHISINWDDVPTLGYQQYPGRLSGENPHPGR